MDVSPEILTVEDSRARKIVVRKLRALERMRFFELIGAENSSNPQYMGIAIFAYSVVSIDGELVPTPSSKTVLEALVQRLGDDAIEAIAAGVQRNFMPTHTTSDEVKTALKNE